MAVMFLSVTGFAHKAQGLAPADFKGHVVNGFEGDGLEAGAHRKVLL